MASSDRRSKKSYYWIIGIILLFIFASRGIGWIVEWDWLRGLGYQQIFWKTKVTQLLLYLGAFIIALVYMIPNMYFLSKNISFIHINLTDSPFENLGYRYINTKQIRILTYTTGIVVSFFFAIAYSGRWNAFFRFFRHQYFGKTDPVFGHDIGFYIFRLPFLETIQNSLTFLVFFATLILIILYMAKGLISLDKIRHAPKLLSSAAVKHISINLGIWFLLLAWGYFLQRYQLLFNQNGVVVGAGYTDIHVTLPVLWVMVVLTILLGLLSFYQFFRMRFRWLIGGGIVVLIIGFIGQAILPAAFRSFVVKPNELKLEKPYLKNNIALTRQAYGLDKFDETSYNASDSLSYAEIIKNMQTIDNIRLWDPRLIIHTYRQLQEIRLYYSFPTVSIGRYHTNLGYKQMMLSARELNTAQLPPKAQTWVNQHLQYTHGFGITMSPVAKTDIEGNPLLLIKDLPPVSDINLKLTQPAIYYGENSPGYKLVNTRVKELDYPKGKDNVYTHYKGKGGVSIDNFPRKLLYSLFFGDFNLLLTDYIKEGSRIQFWQNIQTRVQKIAPFLILKDKPYLVLDDGKLYWIQDAYTTSDNYPYAQTYDGTYNYIRNSVKVVVNAYDGDVHFYISDKQDPVLKVYQQVFPGLFKPLTDLPPGLKQHLRYPEYLFLAQIKLYNAYHMTNPQTFYNNEDLWERPDSKYAGQKIKMQSYYILSKLPHQKQLQYLLISPLTPNDRDNMISWMAAESDFPNYGKVHVYELPKSRLFLGPAQIEAKIDQNTQISRQLSLWDQKGSNVIRGNLMVIPVEKSFLYVEPVFLIAEGVNIPQLKRVIVTKGDRVVMEPTIHEAINNLYGKQPTQAMFAIEDNSHPDSAGISNLTRQRVNNQQLDSMRILWSNMQNALKNQHWEQFGRQMQKIDSLLNQ